MFEMALKHIGVVAVILPLAACMAPEPEAGRGIAIPEIGRAHV